MKKIISFLCGVGGLVLSVVVCWLLVVGGFVLGARFNIHECIGAFWLAGCLGLLGWCWFYLINSAGRV